MKKSLLALAVLGAFAVSAQAQTNVTIGGVIQANLKNYKVGSENALRGVFTPRASTEWRVDDDYTSRFWLTGSEDLGGGNSAIFYIENRFNTDVQMVNGVGNGLGNGDTFVGLKGSWGQLTAGKHTMMYTQGAATEIIAGNGTVTAMPTSMWGTFSILSQINGGYISVSRISNSIMYKSPNFSGFSGSVGVSTAYAGTEGNLNCTGSGQQNFVTNTVANNVTIAGAALGNNTGCPAVPTATNTDYSTGKAYFLQGSYANGPIYVNLAYWKEQAEGKVGAASISAVTGATTLAPVGTDKRELRLSGSYAFPFGLKVGLQYDRANQENSVTGADTGTRTAWQLPVSYAFGPHAVLFSYTRAGDVSTAAGTTANSGAKMFTLGYDYAWSKRTNVGVYYSQLKNDQNGAYQPFLAGTSATGSALLAGESATTWAVGVKHTF